MATLAVTITESVTLNGAARGSTNSRSITGVDDIYHRIVTLADDLTKKGMLYIPGGLKIKGSVIIKDNITVNGTSSFNVLKARQKLIG